MFRRTREGQRELVSDSYRLSAAERGFLAAVTGHTPLRVLLDLGRHSPDIARSIVRLVDLGLIELG